MKHKEIILQKNESCFLDGKFFVVKSGRIIMRELLETGRVIAIEICFSTGDVVGNFFNLLKMKQFEIPEIEMEVVAMDDNTILEEFVVDEKLIQEDIGLKQLITILLKKDLLNLIYQLYNTKGYVLAVLKLYKNTSKFIYKEEICYENFNISKSQFYAAYSKLKEEKFLYEEENKVFFNMRRVNKYLNLLGERI